MDWKRNLSLLALYTTRVSPAFLITVIFVGGISLNFAELLQVHHIRCVLFDGFGIVRVSGIRLRENLFQRRNSCCSQLAVSRKYNPKVDEKLSLLVASCALDRHSFALNALNVRLPRGRFRPYDLSRFRFDEDLAAIEMIDNEFVATQRFQKRHILLQKQVRMLAFKYRMFLFLQDEYNVPWFCVWLFVRRPVESYFVAVAHSGLNVHLQNFPLFRLLDFEA
mmetsp:Transcript_9113/g.11655  ORF Transcript_9113/g.11655 Transcript_9113/m.11655 type:complete len:222 (-) Transcript_9113:638-1303(-)